MTDRPSKKKQSQLAAGQTQRVDTLMHSALEQRVFPGAVLLVGVEGNVVLHKAYGMADLFSERPMTRDTLFDLASLTKPLAMAVACMVLVQQDRLDLDLPCAAIWPSFFKEDKKKITPRHLLSHTSGLPPWMPYFMRLRHMPPVERVAALERFIQAEPLNNLPGQKDDYSDLGYILLQWLVERISGLPLDQWVRKQVYDPLNLSRLFYLDLGRAGLPREQFAAAELCPWRNRLLCGQVHDDNAYVMGGVAGHAGLFGTAMAVFELLQALLKADGQASSPSIFEPAVVHIFFERQGAHRYALGFDTPSDQASSAGHYFPADSVGHLGFTGTSFWANRQKQAVVVLLTNRVHPSRFNLAIKTFRPQLHDAIMESIVR